MIKRPIRVVVLVAATVSAALVASDWPSGLLTGFWAQHSLLGGVISGLILLAIGSLIVERYINAQEARRWKRISHIAYRDLASSQLLAYRILTVSSVGRYGAVDVQDLPPQDWESDVNRILGRYNLRGEGLPRRSLPLLVQDLEWLSLARRSVLQLLEANRAVLAQWSPVLIQTDDLYRGLDVASGANDALRNLSSALRQAERVSDPSRDPYVSAGESESTQRDALINEHARLVEESWIEAMRGALEARDELFRLLKRAEWSNPGWKSLGE